MSAPTPSPTDTGVECLYAAGRAALQLAVCLGVALAVWLLCVGWSLFRRFLGVRFGRRVQADASRAVVVTGATSGFGLAIAKRLHERGFTVFACYYNDREPGHRELGELELGGAAAGSRPRMFLVEMDVRSGGSIESAAGSILQRMEEHGMRLHCLLNNAGIATDGPFEFTSSQAICNLAQTNLLGAYLVTKAFVLRLVQDKGRVVNVSSGVQMFPMRGLSLYGSAKAALGYFSEALDLDLRPYGATCCAILPGNLVLQSSIMLTKAAAIQKSLAQLGADERRVYARKLARFQRTVDHLLHAKLAQGEQDVEKLAKLHGFEAPERLDRAGRAPSRGGPWRTLAAKLTHLLDGGSSGSLEESGAIDCFESAVVLERPPARTFAGNCCYQYLSGPIVEYLPTVMLRCMTRAASDALGKAR